MREVVQLVVAPDLKITVGEVDTELAIVLNVWMADWDRLGMFWILDSQQMLSCESFVFRSFG